MSEVTRTDRIAGSIDQSVTREIAIAKTGPGVPVFASMDQLLSFAKIMAVSGIAVRKHLRDNPGVCAAICMQAQRWEMDPFAVANKSYAISDQIAFESQLIAAVINTRAPITGRLKTRFEGEGQNRKCIASATFIGEDYPTEVESPPISQITPKNSPLWKSDPDQQLAYYTKRLWARREAPEVLLGVYDIDELSHVAPKDITPGRAKGAPKMHSVRGRDGNLHGVYRIDRIQTAICGLLQGAGNAAEADAIYQNNEGIVTALAMDGLDVSQLELAYARARGQVMDVMPEDPEPEVVVADPQPDPTIIDVPSDAMAAEPEPETSTPSRFLILLGAGKPPSEIPTIESWQDRYLAGIRNLSIEQAERMLDLNNETIAGLEADYPEETAAVREAFLNKIGRSS
jgi:hypothetical protein